MATSQVYTSCEPIFSAVRNSKLNFNLQETPFSFYLSIRKSYTKNQTPEVQSSNSVPLLANSELERDFESVKVENKDLKAQLQSLEQVKADLVLDIDEEISNCLETKAKLKSAVTKLNNVESKFEFVETTLKKLQGEKDS